MDLSNQRGALTTTRDLKGTLTITPERMGAVTINSKIRTYEIIYSGFCDSGAECFIRLLVSLRL